MVIQRNIGTAIILSLITCGIYAIYWFIVLTDDVGKLSGDASFTGGKNFLLTLVTCGIWSFVWAYHLGRNIGDAQRQRGWNASDNSVLFIILTFFGLGIVVYALAQSDVNRMA